MTLNDSTPSFVGGDDTDSLPKTPEEFRAWMKEELARFRRELNLTNAPGENGVPLPSKLKKGDRVYRTRAKLPEAASLDEAMKKAGVSRKGRRAYLAANRKKIGAHAQKSA